MGRILAILEPSIGTAYHLNFTRKLGKRPPNARSCNSRHHGCLRKCQHNEVGDGRNSFKIRPLDANILERGVSGILLVQ